MDFNIQQAGNQRHQPSFVMVDQLIGMTDFPKESHDVLPPGPIEVLVQNARELVNIDGIGFALFRLGNHLIDLAVGETILFDQNFAQFRRLGRRLNAIGTGAMHQQRSTRYADLFTPN